MSTTWRQRARPLVLWLGIGGGLLVLAGAYLTDRFFGQDVLLLAGHDPATVELNRALHVDGDPVAELYGNPLSEPVRVLFVSSDLLIRPTEDPELVLLPVDKEKGENPLQAQTLWFFTRYAVPALILGGLMGLFLPRTRRPE